MELEKYNEYLESKSDEDADFDIENFSNREAKQKDDGSWIIELSEINEDGLKDMSKMLGGMEEIFESTHKVKDVEVTMKLDKKYYPKSLDFVIIFEAINGKSSSTLPTITVEADYKDINDTDIEAPDLDGFTETYDLTCIDKVLDGFEKLESYDERVDFTASLLQRVNDAKTALLTAVTLINIQARLTMSRRISLDTTSSCTMEISAIPRQAR